MQPGHVGAQNQPVRRPGATIPGGVHLSHPTPLSSTGQIAVIDLAQLDAGIERFVPAGDTYLRPNAEPFLTDHGHKAHLAVSPQIASALDTVAVVFGVPVSGFAALWAVLATALTTTQLAPHTDLPAFAGATVIGYAGLLSAWLTVAIPTGLGSCTDRILVRPAPGAPVRHVLRRLWRVLETQLRRRSQTT